LICLARNWGGGALERGGSDVSEMDNYRHGDRGSLTVTALGFITDNHQNRRYLVGKTKGKGGAGGTGDSNGELVKLD